MKTLKIIIVIILLIVAIVIILGLLGPKENKVERTVVINAPVELVFEQVKFFKNTAVWSPWKDYDSLMTSSIEGQDGTVGAIMSWEGNKDVGKGKQEITNIVENKRVDSKLTFIEPWESEATGFVELNDTLDTLRVTWGFHSENNFMGRIFALFSGMETMLGKDFEKGVNNLKEICEKLAAEKPATRQFEIKEVAFTPKIFIAKKETVKMTDIPKFFEANFGAIMDILQKSKVQCSGAPCGLYYTWDEQSQSSLMAAAVPVQTKGNITIKGFETIKVDFTKALLIEYTGSFEKSADAYYAMDNYMKEKGIKQLTPIIEEYITDPSQEPDTSKWVTNIYFFFE
ncbi:MAG: SRPBCC family protein [Bacteroidia bacterium]|nr:SRPBCC family protein [Bacteroidia bacterium]